jgi:hypothetical protein
VRERARSRVLICGLLPWWGRGTEEGGDGSKTTRGGTRGGGRAMGGQKGKSDGGDAKQLGNSIVFLSSCYGLNVLEHLQENM